MTKYERFFVRVHNHMHKKNIIDGCTVANKFWHLSYVCTASESYWMLTQGCMWCPLSYSSVLETQGKV